MEASEWWEPALDSLPPGIVSGAIHREEVKPVVTRLVVFGAAVGGLSLLAGAAIPIVRPAQAAAPAIDALRLAQAPTPPTSAPAVPVLPVSAAPDSAAPPGPAVPTPAPPSPEPPVRPQESESTDGSAAVDWLLKGRR